MSRRDPVTVRRPGKGPTRPRFAPAAAPRTLRAPWTEVAPGAGRLRAARERGKPQTCFSTSVGGNAADHVSNMEFPWFNQFSATISFEQVV